MTDSSSRRGLFRSMLNRGVRAATDEVVKRIPTVPLRRRPPGAVSELLFLERCTVCNDCISACPHFAIFSLAENASSGANTPVMVPDQRGCEMCDGWPCAVACEPRALVVPEAKVVSLGVARVAEDRCMVFRGPECGACAGLCPTNEDGPLQALTLSRGRPSIDEDECIGCGLCIIACPTMPSAIDLLPLTAPLVQVPNNTLEQQATVNERTDDVST